jgi:polysaccharide export outer membrane protein
VSAIERGDLSKNILVRNGDSIFVARAGTAVVSGQVRNPGKITVRADTTVQQAVALAGGVTERGSMGRARIVRMVNGERKELKAKETDIVLPGDTLVIGDRLF